jgi:hypothetical protein
VILCVPSDNVDNETDNRQGVEHEVHSRLMQLMKILVQQKKQNDVETNKIKYENSTSMKQSGIARHVLYKH